MILSKCALCNSKKKKKFIKEQEQEACGLLNDLGIKTPLRWIPLVGLLLF